MSEDLQSYMAQVLRFRKALNLTSVSDPDEFDRRFIQPSLALLNWMPQKGILLDIGSGMGIPGIPLLLSSPALRGVLVERRKKRAEFLRHLVRTLPHLRAVVMDVDINNVRPLQADVCVARAVTDQQQLLHMAAKHLRLGGRVVMPVPLASAEVRVDGWKLEEESLVETGVQQLVRCYRYVGRRAPEDAGKEPDKSTWT